MNLSSHFWHIFLHKAFFQPYFLKIRVIFGAGTPNQVYWMMLMIIIALYLPPVIPSTYCSFVLLSLSDIFDTRDNGSTGHRTWDHRFEWSIMTTCHLQPVTWYLWHLCTCCDVKNRWWHNDCQLAARYYYCKWISLFFLFSKNYGRAGPQNY